MAKKRKSLQPDEPLYHVDHPKPVTRRDFLRQGFISGAGILASGGVFSLFANPRAAYAQLSGDIQQLAADAGCPIQNFTGGSIPFICFDLAGGANISGSNVLVGQQGGQVKAAGLRAIHCGLPLARPFLNTGRHQCINALVLNRIDDGAHVDDLVQRVADTKFLQTSLDFVQQALGNALLYQ